MSKPIVCIPANSMMIDGVPAHQVKHQYVAPLIELIDCVPLIIPAVGSAFNLKDIAGRIDGLLLTGAPSHLNPDHYGCERNFRETDLDHQRDATTLPTLRQAIELDIPVFAICRGFQELNVACGGTLHQHLHKMEGKLDHRGDRDLPLPERYKTLAHRVMTQKGGLFEKLKLPSEFAVNSLHQQGVDKLGKGLFAEAISEDGIVEAVTVPGKRFILGTQWHPEGNFEINDVSAALFREFGRALREKKA